MSTTALDPTTANSPSPARAAVNPLRAVVKALASLQLTVGLFALGVGLIFFGTLAQKGVGIWTVVEQYFWSWVVMVPFDLFQKFGQVFFDLPKDAPPWRGSFPFPGGKLLGVRPREQPAQVLVPAVIFHQQQDVGESVLRLQALAQSVGLRTARQLSTLQLRKRLASSVAGLELISREAERQLGAEVKGLR